MKPKAKMMSGNRVTTLMPYDAGWPETLASRLGKASPRKLQLIGSLNLLALRKTALFCSARVPGNVILRAHDIAQQLRDEGATVISGFHSPIEKDCLKILLRGKRPIVICFARAIEKIRLPSTWRTGLASGRLLILSPFEKRPRRPTVDSARHRNEVVAALADEVVIFHATPGGQIDRLSKFIERWHIPQRKLIGISRGKDATDGSVTNL
jgi:predicted Rossmann fold nucleotide-binding protein DprA/Smf involved in DNA uptake